MYINKERIDALLQRLQKDRDEYEFKGDYKMAYYLTTIILDILGAIVDTD